MLVPRLGLSISSELSTGTSMFLFVQSGNPVGVLLIVRFLDIASLEPASASDSLDDSSASDSSDDF